jgi:hypothetical protein
MEGTKSPRLFFKDPTTAGSPNGTARTLSFRGLPFIVVDTTHTYEDPEKAAAEPTVARRATAENFILRVTETSIQDEIGTA